MPDTDPIAAYLDEVRQRVSELERLITHMAIAAVSVQDFNAAQDRLAACTPRLLAALDGVLALADSSGPVSENPTGGAYAWSLDPTEVRAAISAALLGEEGGDG